MSVRVMADVWAHSQARGTDLLVMLAIADHAGDQDRTAWPSLGHLSSKCRVSRSTIKRSVWRLSRMGELAIVMGTGQVNRYTVFDPVQHPTQVNLNLVHSSDPPGGVQAVDRGVGHSCDPQTIKEPSRREPSGVATPKVVAPKKHRMPDDFALNDAMRAYAEKGDLNAGYEFGKFKDYHRANGTRHVDWVAAWRYWVRNSVEREESRHGRRS